MWTLRRRAVVRGVALAWLLLAWAARAFALNPALDINQYAHTTWRIRDGFFKGTINSIAQTPDGYLWLATEVGLAALRRRARSPMAAAARPTTALQQYSQSLGRARRDVVDWDRSRARQLEGRKAHPLRGAEGKLISRSSSRIVRARFGHVRFASTLDALRDSDRAVSSATVTTVVLAPVQLICTKTARPTSGSGRLAAATACGDGVLALRRFIRCRNKRMAFRVCQKTPMVPC